MTALPVDGSTRLRNGPASVPSCTLRVYLAAVHRRTQRRAFQRVYPSTVQGQVIGVIAATSRAGTLPQSRTRACWQHRRLPCTSGGAGG